MTQYPFLVLVAALALLLGCDSKSELEKWMNSVAPLKTVALQQASPYRRSEHEKLKAYFEAIAKKAYELKAESKAAEQLQKDFLQAPSAKEVCEKVLISRWAWEQLQSHCHKNEFFLCAEEVRAYPDAVTVIKNSLNGESLKRFETEPSCSQAL